MTGSIGNTANVTSNLGDPDMTNNSASQVTRVVSLPSIFGRVLAGDGQGVSGVTVALAGGQKPAVVTGSDGGYQFGELTEGVNYTVTPTKTGLAFSPASRQFNNLNSDQRADFTARCSLVAIPGSFFIATAGGTASIRITAGDSSCAWSASSNDPWIRVTTPSGSGSGIVNFTIDPASSPRQGSITIADQVIPVRQGNTIRR